MDKYEVKRLTICRGLLNGRISEYVLAVVKDTKSILAAPMLVEILDNYYIECIKKYIQYDSCLYINDTHCLPDEWRYIYGEVFRFNLSGQFVKRYNNFYSGSCVEKYKSVEYDSIMVGQVPEDVHCVFPLELKTLSPHIYTNILVFVLAGIVEDFQR